MTGLKVLFAGIGIKDGLVEIYGVSYDPAMIHLSDNPNRPKTTIKDKARLATSEFIGTAILIFVGCIGCVDTITFVPDLQLICLTFGIAVMIAIVCVGHLSGGHINPAVTISAIIIGQLKEIELVPIYIVSQIFGSVFGYGLLRVFTPTQYFQMPKINEVTNETYYGPGICTTVPSVKISLIQAIGVEIVLTFILIFLCCGIWDVRNKNHHDSVAIKFGLAVAALAMCAGSYTGASMNPVRSFGPALYNMTWTSHWIYWFGPITGSIIASTVYRLIFALPQEPYMSPDEV